MKKKEIFKRYDRRNPEVDRSEVGQHLHLISLTFNYTDTPIAQLIFKQCSESYAPPIEFRQMKDDEVSGRFCLSNTLKHIHTLMFMEDVDVIMPSGSFYLPQTSSLVEESLYMSLLWFHRDVINDKYTNWKWRIVDSYKATSVNVHGTIGWCYHRFYNQYFHWFIDCLPRLWILENAKIVPDFYFFGDIKNIDYAIESLQVLGIDISKCIFLSEEDNINIKNVYFPISRLQEERMVRPSLGNGVHYKGGWDPLYLHYLNTLFIERVQKKSNAVGPKRLFVDRQDASHRRLKNDTEIYEVLSSYGFESINPSEYSFIDQVKIFSDAELIVGIHGAGLTNLLWIDCCKEPKVLEIVVGGIGDPGYRLICAGLGVDYSTIEAQPCGNHSGGIAFDDIYIDPVIFNLSLVDLIS